MSRSEEVTMTWSDAVQTGTTRVNTLKYEERTDSAATKLDDMVGPGNGWVVDDYEGFDAVPEHWGPIYAELGISVVAEENHYRDAKQTVAFSNSFGKNIPATRGFFKSGININSGTMVALSNRSPLFLIGKSDPAWKKKLPTVSKMSDVLWIQWVEVAAKKGTPEKISDLQYIFQYDVTTPNSKFIIEQAAAKHSGDDFGEDEFDTEWPGYTFTEKDEQFKALLGTAQGTTTFYLLMTHATGLPGKSIESVTIFTTEGDKEDGEVYNMLWKLKN